MSDDLVKQALAELGDVVRCRCREAYTGLGLHDPDCQCDSAEAVKVVADHIEQLVAINEELEAKLAECEARLEKAAESLTIIDALDPEGMINGCSQSALIGLVSRMGAIARTTLTELKGSNT